MTSRDEATRPARGVAQARLRGDRPLTVAMVTRRTPSELGGVERVVTGLLGELARTRPSWRVDTVSAFREGSRLEGMDGLSDVIASLRLGRRLRNSTADVIFVHCPECLWGVRLLRRRRGGPSLVAVWHGAGPTPHLVLRQPGHLLARALAWLRTTEERRALPADGHIAVHAGVRDDLRSLYGLSKSVTVIENALDATILDELSRPADGRERAGLTATWVGQTSYRKGLDVALVAVAEARRDVPMLRLAVVGVPAGEEAEGVDWLGVIPPAGMAAVYRNADLFIFPTRYESFGLVVVEAMAAGLPVIVSDALPTGIVADGRNGVVIAGHDPSHYAAALRRLADPRTRAAMAEANREDARRFSIESTGAGYAAVAESFAAIQ
jgi:glycosyltransferase involved in cell wall biosynthesis